MCNLRSQKRFLETESGMDISMAALNGSIPATSFHHGHAGVPASEPMFAPDLCASSMDSYEDLRHLLMCATLELESARTAASAQGELHKARVRHLEELLKTTRRERDEAREQFMSLQGRLSRSSSRNGSGFISGLSNAVDAAVEAHNQQKQQLEELQQHLELHEQDLSSSLARSGHDDQHMEDVSQVHHHFSPPRTQVVRQDSHLEQLEESSQVLRHLNLPSPDGHSGLHPLSQMHSPEDQCTLSRLQEMNQTPPSPDLQVEHTLHQQQQQHLDQNVHHHHLNHHVLIQQRTDEQLEHESEQILSQMQQRDQQHLLQAEQEALLLMREALPPISVKRHRDSPSALSVMQHRESPSGLSVRLRRETPLSMSVMSHRDSPTAKSVMQHRDSPTVLSAIQHRESPSAMSFMQHRESPSAMSVMQHPAWQAIPGGNSPYSSPGLCSPPLSSGLGLPSVNLQGGSAVASLLSPLERYETLGGSSPMHLTSRPVHLPEPPEADLQVMLKSLPEKGKLLQAVMQAGPLLQTLLVAGPLPQWRHPPPALDTLDIPRVSMSSTSCDMSQTSLNNTGLMAGSSLGQHSAMHLPVPIPSHESPLSHLSLPLPTMSTGASTGRSSPSMIRVNSMGHLGSDMRMSSSPLKYAKIY